MAVNVSAEGTTSPATYGSRQSLGRDKVNEPTSEENATKSQPFKSLRAEGCREVSIYLTQGPHITGGPFRSLHSDATEAPPRAEPWHAEKAISLPPQAHAYPGVAEAVHVAVPTT